ncbi:MAG: response regulator [Synechococcus sp.]|nr:response regulator [Synechococcus sp.]
MEWGATVVTAANGAIALELWAAHLEEEPDSSLPPFGFLIMDEFLPDMAGQSLIERFQQAPRHQGIVNLIVTAINRIEVHAHLRKLPATRCLTKPVSPLELWAALGGAEGTGTETITPAQVPAGLGSGTIMLGDRHLLLVEDNPMNQIVVREMGALYGLDIQVVASGIDCLEYLRQSAPEHPVELILMDCMMPQMDGYETTQRIRAGEGGRQYQDLPVVAITANALDSDRQACLAAGMNDCLVKPLDLNEFIEMLTKWLS